MRRILILAATAAFAVSAAQAAPFHSLKASSGGSSAASTSDISIVMALFSFFGLDVVSSGAPISEKPGAADAKECEADKKARAKEEKKKTAGAAGPEPAYLAF